MSKRRPQFGGVNAMIWMLFFADNELIEAPLSQMCVFGESEREGNTLCKARQRKALSLLSAQLRWDDPGAGQRKQRSQITIISCGDNSTILSDNNSTHTRARAHSSVYLSNSSSERVMGINVDIFIPGVSVNRRHVRGGGKQA